MQPENPMFAKFDAALGKTTPTATGAPVSTRADEIRALGQGSTTTDVAPNFSDAIHNMGNGNTQDNVDVAKGSIKQIVKDISSVGAQNAGPVGAAMKANAPEFSKSIDALNTKMTPSNPAQKKGALDTSIAEGIIPVDKAAIAAKDAIAPLVKKSTSLTDGVLREKGVLTPEKAQTAAWKDMQPKPTDANIQAYRGKGETNPKTLTKGVTFNPTAADKKVLEHIAPLYEDGTLTPKMTTEEKISAIEGQSKDAVTAVDNYITDNNKVVTIFSRHPEFNTLDKALTKAKSGNDVLFAGDKTVEGAYDAVTQEFKKGLSKGTPETTDLVSLRSRLKEFDAEMQSKFPNVYKSARTGEMTSTDNARFNAIRDVHQTVRDLISEHLPPNNPYKPMLQKISSYIKGAEMINESAPNASKITDIVAWIKAHPYIQVGLGWEALKHTVAPGLPGL